MNFISLELLVYMIVGTLSKTWRRGTQDSIWRI